VANKFKIMDTNLVEENKKPNMIKPAMNFGLYFGVILVAFSVLSWALNMMMESYLTYINYIVMIACLYFFAKKYRDEHAGGYITYGKALKFNALTLVFTSFIVGFYTFIFFKFIEPTMIEKILEKTRDVMIEKNADLTEEQIDIALAMQKKFMTPLLMFISSIFGTYLMGIIFSLVTSIFVKKKDNTIDNSTIPQ